MTWINPEDSNFNSIKDGADVSESVNNVVFNNIRDNLLYLYDKLTTLSIDKSSLVLYGEPISEDTLLGLTTDDYKTGVPVFLYEGAWKPAGIEVDPTKNTESRWGYDIPSFSCGMILRQYESQGLPVVDVILAGDHSFEVLIDEVEPSDSIIGTNGNTLLSDLFTDDCFDLDGDVLSYRIEFLKSGVYYLSDEGGKLTTDTTFTIALGVIFVVQSEGNYFLRVFVQPEGLAGHRKHQHESVRLHAGLACTTQIVETSALPSSWATNVDGMLPLTSLNVGGDNVQYPYEDLVGITVETTDAERVMLLYDDLEAIDAHGGWLSAADDYFTRPIVEGGLGLTEDLIPAGAIWGYTVNRLDKFNYSWSTINGVYDLESMILTINGQPVNKNYYAITESGIWWLQDGYENAPFPTRILYDKILDLYYINPVLASETASIGSIVSSRLLVNQEGSTASLDTLDGFLSIPMQPVLPFNPTLDLLRATVDESKLGSDSRKILTPMTAVELVGNLFSTTKSGTARAARVYENGSFNSLTQGGFWKASNCGQGPASAGPEFLGMVINGTNSLAQIFLDTTAGTAFYRVATGSGQSLSWSNWINITPPEQEGEAPPLLPSGCIMMWPVEVAPVGWLHCNGAIYNITQHPEYAGLFANLGNKYGGDGISTFGVPDYRGLFVRGWNDTRSDGYSDPDRLSRDKRSDGMPGNKVGTLQVDTYEAHNHRVVSGGGGSNTNPLTGEGVSATPNFSGADYGTGLVTQAVADLLMPKSGGVETRPNNIYAMYIIKY